MIDGNPLINLADLASTVHSIQLLCLKAFNSREGHLFDSGFS